jgi:ribosome maturation protein Sdo1
VEWTWKHLEFCPWARSNSDDADKFDFDVTKADRIFDMLLEKGHIKLTANHKMPSAEELKKRRYCKYHGTSTHHTNDCRVFRECIQKAIEQERITLRRTRNLWMFMDILSLRIWLQ